MKGQISEILATAGVIALAVPISAQASKPDSCRVTAPNGIVAGSSRRNENSYGNTLLSVGPFGLWPSGTVVFKPGGAGFQTQDGALGMKFGWTRGIRGKLSVSGRRIDADAPPLRFETSTHNSDSGFLASYLIFSTPGCWEVTAQIDGREDSKITFVTRVEKIGDGPEWRRYSEPLVPPPEPALLGEWNRVNTGRNGGNPSIAEHEVMHFWVEGSTWAGRYDKRPEPSLGFPNPPDRTFGVFIGSVAKDFVCQPTFPFYPCQNVVQVIEGTTRYSPSTGLPFDVLEQHIVVRQENGQEIMWQYWVSPGNFACPWYRIFPEALAAEPFRTHGDCIFQVTSP